MKDETDQSKKILLLLILSVCINLLYFFNILNFKIPLLPSKDQAIKKEEVHQFIDSPLPERLLKDNDVKDTVRTDRK